MKKAILTGLTALFFHPIFAPCQPATEQENRLVNNLMQAQENRAKKIILMAILAQETRGNWYLYNSKEKAAGGLQIRPIMIKEANRIAGYQKYSLASRWDSVQSVQLFWEVQNHWKTGLDPVKIALLWNTGQPQGAPNNYTKCVLKHMENIALTEKQF